MRNNIYLSEMHLKSKQKKCMVLIESMEVHIYMVCVQMELTSTQFVQLIAALNVKHLLQNMT